MDKSNVILNKIDTNIYGIAVNHIADNFVENSGITKLGAIILPDCITTIGKRAFYKQTLLYDIALPGVKHIGDSAFEGCIHAVFTTGDNVEPTLETIGEKAFYNCPSIKLTKDQNFSEIGNEAFVGTGLKEINLGGSVQFIGVNVFNTCSSLKTIIILCPNPPTLNGVLYSSSTPLSTIKVPFSSLNIYQTSNV